MDSMSPKITKRSVPEIVSGYLFRSPGAGFLRFTQSHKELRDFLIKKKFRIGILSLLVIVSCPLFISSTYSADGDFYLSFPLPNRDSSNAVINTVFDHSTSGSYVPDGTVTAYTGEEGRSEWGQSLWSTDFGSGLLYGFSNSSGIDFVVNGNYAGAGEPNYLFYDGHPGFDYRTTDQSADGRINVLAAAAGTAQVVSGSAFNTLIIDHLNGYETHYLHLSEHLVADGLPVARGEIIGTSGDIGSPGAPHLHFEVLKNGVPVDPYGWQGSGTDPYFLATGVTNVELWTPPNIADVSEVFPTPLEPVLPSGSLIYGLTHSSSFATTGEVHSYSIELDAGQTITIRFAPQDVSISGEVELFDPGASSLGISTASIAGEALLLQTVPVASAGIYNFNLTSVAGAGAYEVEVVLNSTLETESYGGVANDTTGTAQDLTSSAIALQGSSERMAVLGEADGGDDYYSFDLVQGESASLVLTSLNGGNVGLELQNPSGVAVALGVSDARNVDQSISDVIAPVSGTYFVRASGDAGQRYSLVVTHNASFDLEEGGRIIDSQEIGVTKQILGALSAENAITGGAVIRVAVHGSSDSIDAQAVVDQLNDDTFFDFEATLVSGSQIDTITELDGYDVVILGDGAVVQELESLAPALRTWVESGGGVIGTGFLLCMLDPLCGSYTGTSRVDIDAVIPVDMSVPNVLGIGSDTIFDIQDDSHPVTAGITALPVAGVFEAAARADPGANVLATISGGFNLIDPSTIIDNQPAVVTGKPGGKGRSVYLAPMYMSDWNGQGSVLRTGSHDQLLEQAVAWAAAVDRQDYFQFDAQEGDALVITTTTPGGGNGEPDNSLDPAIELFDANGTSVAADDNSAADARNARIAYTVPSGGSGGHRIEVVPASGEGDYTLSIAGAAGSANPPPEVVSTIPSDGEQLATPPAYLDVVLSEAVRVDSVNLSASGVADYITGVNFLDGRTVRFTLSLPPDLEGSIQYPLGAGTFVDLQGQPSLEYSGSFTIDQTAPQVIAHLPDLTASAPLTELTFTFSEDINPETFTTTDIVSFTGPGGINLLGQITGVSGSGTQFTVTFSPQSVQGTYTMIIGPDIEDPVGNPMDQNSNGVKGEPGDTYTAAVILNSPDLVVESVQIPGSGQFGQTIDVTWTVRNTGSDTAIVGWSDRIYLSFDNTLGGDILLLTQSAGGAIPLPASQSYTRTVSVTLPLNASLAEGSYFIIVQTDATGTQPETNETNNINASQSIAITLPSLPDLVVSNISAPIEVISGQEATITWTITNQGDNEATGTWNDYVYLSNDPAVGGDQWIGAFSFSGTIAAGESVVRTQTITVPITLSGDHWVVIHTDANNQIFEHANDNNNTAVDGQPINIILSPFPNLQVTAVTVPPTVFSGQQTVITWTVMNNGNGATNAPVWYDSVWLSTNTTLDGSDTFLGQADNTSYLDVGESYVNSLTVALPQGIDGDYYFIVKTDHNNQVNEFLNEGDNIGSGGTTNVQLTPPPDLQVTGVNAPSQAFSGQIVSLGWTVSNQGSGGTLVSTWHDDLYMSEDEVLDASDYYLGRYAHNGALGSGESYSTVQNVTIPTGISGGFYFFVRTDSLSQVYEHAFETNNTGYDITVTTINLTPPPDLEVVSVDAPDAAIAGHSITVSYSVANNGSTATPNSSWTEAFYLSADTQFDAASDLLLGYRSHSGALDIGVSYSDLATFTLPDGLNGSYYVFVRTDSGGSVFEAGAESNNLGVDSAVTVITSQPADLVVSAANSPANGEAGSAILVDWTVSNQGLGDTVVTTWADKIYASTDTNLGNGDDILLGAFPHSGLLNTGESYSRTELVTIPFSMNGQYQFFIVADADGSVYEAGNEGNNSSSAMAVAVSRQTADLQVTEVNIPAAAISGESITIAWTVQNPGNGTTNVNYWYDDIYLSSDSLEDAGDTYLGRVYHTGALGSSSQYNTSRSFALPPDLAGDFYLIVHTDASDLVEEDALENNNGLASATTMAIALDPSAGLLPDLVMDSVNAPNMAISGQPFEVTWTVRNDGDTGSNNTWHDAVYLSLDQVFDPSTDIYLGFLDHPGGLGAGVSYTATDSFTVPLGLSGYFYVFVVSDGGGTVNEGGSELNNIGYDANSIQVALAPPADLVVTSSSIPLNAVPGEDVTISYVIENQGANPAQGSWFDSIYISSDPEWDIGDKLFGRVQHTGDVQGNNSYTQSFTAAFPGMTPGNYYVIIRTDIKNNVNEGVAEANNSHISTNMIAVDVQGLVLGNPYLSQLGTGMEHAYKVDVPEGEDLLVVLDSESDLSVNELYIRFGAVPDRGNYDYLYSDPFKSDQEIKVPTTQAGTYYILVRGDQVPDAPANYSIKAELLEFGVTSFLPTTGGDNGRITVLISGAHFKPGVDVRLARDTNSDLVAEDVTVYSSTKIGARFDLRNQELGTWMLTVQNPNEAAATAVVPFTIEPGVDTPLEIGLLGPEMARPGRDAYYQLVIRNNANTDAERVLIQVRVPYSDGLLVSRVTNGPVAGEFDSRTIANALPADPDGMRTLTLISGGLPAGQQTPTASIRVSVPSTSGNTQIPVQVRAGQTSSEQFDQMFQGAGTKYELAKQLCEEGVLTEDVCAFYANEQFAIEQLLPAAEEILVDQLSGFYVKPIVDYVFFTALCAIQPQLCVLEVLYAGWEAWSFYNQFNNLSTIAQENESLTVVRPVDPNDIIGPEGFGEDQWIAKSAPIPYTIRFENDLQASAPVQELSITQVLDPDIDPRTFRIGNFGWGDMLFEVPENRSYYSEQIDLTDTLGIVLNVAAGIDVITRQAFWSVTAVDPGTGELPTDALMGFLPVNDENGSGEGFVSYTVRPRVESITGTIIDTEARIIFDTEEPIATPPIFHTIDAGIPDSQVAMLPATSEDTTIMVSWLGSDEQGGSGLADFTVYVSDNDGPYIPWLLDTTLTEAPFVGETGHTYAFYSIARDNAGNVELAPDQSDATITLGVLDQDGDGIAGNMDNCPLISNDGQEDADDDGVGDACDNCILVTNVDQRDTDGDGYGNMCDGDLNNDNIVNSLDLGLFKLVYMTTDADADFNGDGIVDSFDLGLLKQMYAKPPGPAPDTDNDGIPDSHDNCIEVANADQRDTNDDGYGNICDGDLNNDNIVNSLDLGLFKQVYMTNDPDADFNGDGLVDSIDLGLLKQMYVKPPGPSGIAP